MTAAERIEVLREQVTKLEMLATAALDPNERDAVLREVEAIRSMVDAGGLDRARAYPVKPRRKGSRR